MNRIKIRDLEIVVNHLNLITGHSLETHTRAEVAGLMRYKANIGTYYLDGAYGGYALYQIVNDGGGIRDISNCGHVPKRELYDFVQGLVQGVQVSSEPTL